MKEKKHEDRPQARSNPRRPARAPARLRDAARQHDPHRGRFHRLRLQGGSLPPDRLGPDARSFLREGRWERLLGEITPGDTVLIQFGHNDATRAKPERWAPAQTDYRNNLLRFIWDARTAGGTPVLVTPVARRSFGADGKAKADFADYSAVMRDLSASTHTPLIDLEALSRAWVDRAGEAASKTYYLHYAPEDHAPGFPKGIADNTHFSEVGARNVANLVAGGLKALNLPISAKVLADRPALARITPLGKTSCQ